MHGAKLSRTCRKGLATQTMQPPKYAEEYRLLGVHVLRAAGDVLFKKQVPVGCSRHQQSVYVYVCVVFFAIGKVGTVIHHLRKSCKCLRTLSPTHVHTALILMRRNIRYACLS